MSGIGPDLPPHLLAKRKRKQEEEAENEAVTASGAKRSASPGDGEKRRRVMGPVMPPAPLNERPQTPVQQSAESDSDDDDFGPALPASGQDKADMAQSDDHDTFASTSRVESTPEAKQKRDEWMTMPPKQDDLAARMDPTKQRPRAFNTGKGAKGPSTTGDDNSSWHETPEQKQKRLADELMGVSKPTAAGPRKPQEVATGKDEAAAQKIREHTEKTRGSSLLDQHQKSKGKEAEDDPSKRAFDREKDMGSGMRIGHAQRKEMLNKASGLNSKFSAGSYL